MRTTGMPLCIFILIKTHDDISYDSSGYFTEITSHPVYRLDITEEPKKKKKLKHPLHKVLLLVLKKKIKCKLKLKFNAWLRSFE